MKTLPIVFQEPAVSLLRGDGKGGALQPLWRQGVRADRRTVQHAWGGE